MGDQAGQDAAAGVREALEWYADKVAWCRKIGSAGDPARHALDADGGKRAFAALRALASTSLLLTQDGAALPKDDGGEIEHTERLLDAFGLAWSSLANYVPDAAKRADALKQKILNAIRAARPVSRPGGDVEAAKRRAEEALRHCADGMILVGSGKIESATASFDYAMSTIHDLAVAATQPPVPAETTGRDEGGIS